MFKYLTTLILSVLPHYFQFLMIANMLWTISIQQNIWIYKQIKTLDKCTQKQKSCYILPSELRNRITESLENYSLLNGSFVVASCHAACYCMAYMIIVLQATPTRKTLLSYWQWDSVKQFQSYLAIEFFLHIHSSNANLSHVAKGKKMKGGNCDLVQLISFKNWALQQEIRKQEESSFQDFSESIK